MKADWQWLVDLTSVGDNFRKCAWVVFFPRTTLYNFSTCQTVSLVQGTSAFNQLDVAPYLPFAEVEVTNGGRQRLTWRAEPPTVSFIAIKGGKKVRADIVGSPADHPLWAAIFTRVTGALVPEGADTWSVEDAAYEIA